MSGNINLRNLAVRSRGKIRHHVALNRQYLPVLFRCPVRRLPGLPLTEKGPQPEYGGSISGRRASYSLLMERHGVMSFSEGIRVTPGPNQDIKDRRRWSLPCSVLSEQYCSCVARQHWRGIAASQVRTMASTPRGFILSWQPRHESFAAPKLNGVTADKARLLILLP
jgi:hypothetical protein